MYYLVRELLKSDRENELLLFYNGFRKGELAFNQNIPNLKQVWSGLPGLLLKPLWRNLQLPAVEYALGKIDVFHHTFNYNFTHYTPVPSYAKSVVTFNGMADPSTIWDSSKYNLKEIDRWFAVIARKASRIIAVSGMVKEDLLKRVDVAQEKIKIVYYGVDEIFIREPEPAIMDEVLIRYGLKGMKYVFYAGAAEKNKNLSGLIEAFIIIMNNPALKDVCLVLGGSIDDNFQRLIIKVRDMGIDKRVIFPGYISHDYLPCVYRGAIAFVLPTFKEWFGIPALEAMASGVPVVVSKNTGALEVVGDAAVTFDPYDARDMSAAISKALLDHSLRRNMIEKGLKIAGEFSWKRTAEETLAVYKEASQTCGH